MAGRRTGKIEGSNLRILAIAFANNRIDRKTYLRLRTQQLSALEFSKPLPTLPPELLDISVPSVKIDAPHVNSKPDYGPVIKWLIAALIALAAATAGYVGYLRLQNSSEVEAPTLEQQARTLLAKQDWAQKDLDAFADRWSALSEEEKHAARQELYFIELSGEIERRIGQIKQQRGTTDNLREYQNRLNALRVFYTEVVVE